MIYRKATNWAIDFVAKFISVVEVVTLSVLQVHWIWFTVGVFLLTQLYTGAAVVHQFLHNFSKKPQKFCKYGLNFHYYINFPCEILELTIACKWHKCML